MFNSLFAALLLSTSLTTSCPDCKAPSAVPVQEETCPDCNNPIADHTAPQLLPTNTTETTEEESSEIASN